MKHILSLILILGLYSHSFTQQKIPISFSYLGNFAIQPGFKVGTQFNLRTWEKENSTKQQTLGISPQLAIFSRIKRNTNYLLNVDASYQLQNTERKFYQAFGLGLGYLMQAELLSFSVNLGSGETTDKDKELKHFLIPNIHYEFGGYIGQKRSWAWYSKYSLGSKLFGNTESTMFLFVEVGGKVFLSKQKNKND